MSCIELHRTDNVSSGMWNAVETTYKLGTVIDTEFEFDWVLD